MRLIFSFIIIILISCNSVEYQHASMVSYIPYQRIKTIYHDIDAGLVFLTCFDGKSVHDRNPANISIRVLDDETLSEINRIQMDELPSEIVPINKGKTLLATFSEIKIRSRARNHGSLKKIDVESGAVIDEIAFERAVNRLIVDKDQKYAYLRIECESNKSSRGRENIEETHLLCKVDIDTMRVVVDRPLNEEYSQGLLLSPDNKTVFNITRHGSSIGSNAVYRLSAYRTEDLSLVNQIRILDGQYSYEVSRDNRLFLSTSHSRSRNIPTLEILDITECEIIGSERYGIVNFTSLLMDPIDDILYANTKQPVEVEREWGGSKYSYTDSNKIMMINLNDYIAETFSICDEPVMMISVSLIGNKRRFLTLSEDKDLITYYDLDLKTIK